jgi:hypothetical protein
MITSKYFENSWETSIRLPRNKKEGVSACSRKNEMYDATYIYYRKRIDLADLRGYEL